MRGAAVESTVFTVALRTVSLTNQRDAHWRHRHRRSKTERLHTWRAWLAAGGRVLKDGERAAVTLTRIAPGTLDDDNLRGAMKSCRDAIAACLGLDDGDERLTFAYAQERGRSYAVRVEIEVSR